MPLSTERSRRPNAGNLMRELLLKAHEEDAKYSKEDDDDEDFSNIG